MNGEVVAKALCCLCFVYSIFLPKPVLSQTVRMDSFGESRLVPKVDPGWQNISLDRERVVRRDALYTIAKAANFTVSYDGKDQELKEILERRVTLSLSNVSLETALRMALQHSKAQATIDRLNRVILIQRDNGNTTRVQSYVFIGTVKDSATGTGLPGVAVTIGGTNFRAMTNARGEFAFKDAPPGALVVKFMLMGYGSVTRSIEMKSGEVATLHVVLKPTATQLSGVVTTATGEQRKVEVGNDITTLRVDSIVRTMPVQNMSVLLATRVPGLYAAPTSGNPGAPTKIRIRGVSSVNESNDPIIIVDGIRVASESGRGSYNLAEYGSSSSHSYLVSSPLDLIDVNSVETVEVLKGPSAVALYGSDAANGVIVVTTKRGHAGPPRVNMSVQLATVTIPGKWPSNYWMWGHTAADPTTPIRCPLERQVQGGCIADSMETYQYLNDPRRTTLGRGLTQTYRGEVSGSNRGVTYALSGSITAVTGVVKLPDIDRDQLIQAGEEIPSWLRHPESDLKKGGALSINTDVGPYSTVSFRSQLMSSATDGSPLGKTTAGVRTLTIGEDQTKSRLLQDVENYRQRIRSQALKSTNSLDITSVFGTRLNTQLTVGSDVMNRTDISTLGAGECFRVSPSCLNDGIYNTGQGVFAVTTANARATSPLQVRNFLSLRSSVGVNYTQSSSGTLVVQAAGLPMGATSGMFAERFTQQQSHDDRITAGMYVETVLGVANRWYLPLAVRTDAGSALGSQIMPKFPKLGVSYILSDDSWFQSMPGASAISMLRMRAAYGQAGVQPAVSKKDRYYQQASVSLGGVSTSYLTIQNIGNTHLRPERSREFEGGIDLDVFNDRVSTSVTVYRKNTVDLLTDVAMPPSVSGGGSQQVNLGDVVNTGVEVSMNVTSVEHRIVRLVSGIQFSLNRNRLTRLGCVQSGCIGQQAVGYPLNGYWARPVVGVFDLNHDGLVSSTEYVLGDDRVYLGAPYPRYTINSNHSMTVLQRVNVTGLLQYENGLTQNRVEGPETVRAYFDPNTSLEAQAITLYSDLNRIQTVSVLRFDELSIGYDLPKQMTSRFLRNRLMRIAVQARNVGLWTKYRGNDPKVNSKMDEQSVDNNTIPQPKIWQLSIGIN